MAKKPAKKSKPKKGFKAGGMTAKSGGTGRPKPTPTPPPGQ